MVLINLSENEIEEIKKILDININLLIKGCETLNMEMAFKIFKNSPFFLMMGTDGTLCDYNTYINNNINYLKECSNFKLVTYNKEIRILDQNNAIYSWTYGVEATLKTGDKDIIKNAGASFIFKKINSKWEVVYYHESSLPMERTKI